MKAYIIGFFASALIVILNLVGGNATTGFSAIHCWALAIIALIACGYGVWDAWTKQQIMNMIEDAGLLEKLEGECTDIADIIIDKFNLDPTDLKTDEPQEDNDEKSE